MMSSKAALGKRYLCFQCERPFYDLNRPEPVCPKCGADQREDPSPDPRVAVMAKYKTSSRPSKPKVKVPSAAYAGDLDDENEEDLDDTAVDDDDDDDETPDDVLDDDDDS